MYEEIIRKCVLFSGLNDKELKHAVEFFRGEIRSYKRGDLLKRPEQKMTSFGLVLDGSIHVFMDDFDGNHLLMAGVTPGITFGESLCYLGQESLITVESMSDSVVLVMKTDALHGSLHPEDIELYRRFTAMLAERTLRLNDRIQILSKPSIREKVITLLSQYAAGKEQAVVNLPFNRETMATYLGVNQSALSRELSRMQDEGIIRFHGSRFTIL